MTVQEYRELMLKEETGRTKNKYRNKKVYVFEDGFFTSDKTAASRRGLPIEIYDSVKEFERCCELRMFEKAGIISNLRRQVDFVISDLMEINGEIIHKITYKADFVYDRDGDTIIEDVKPFDEATGKYRLTKDFIMKWKLLKIKYLDCRFELF